MSNADDQIIRLLTEMRDAHREEMAYRRNAIDESLALARRGLRMQRIGLLSVLAVVVVVVVVISSGVLLSNK